MDKIFENCIPMLQIIGAYGVVYILNCFFGLYNNCLVAGEKFIFKKLIASLLKLVLCAVSGVGIVIGFNLLSASLEIFGFNINEMLQDSLSIFTFVILFFEAFVATAKDVFEKIKGITEVSITLEEATEKVLKYQKPKIETTGESAEGVRQEDYTVQIDKVGGVG